MIVSENELFEMTYSKYGTRLYRFCHVQLRNTHDAEDAVQEVFIKRLYNAPDFKSDEHERNWMYRVALNVCRDRFKQKHHLDLPIDCAEDVSVDGAQTLLDCVMALPDKFRIVLHLHYYEGYSVKEISKLLGTTESSVKMRLKRGRDKLRDELEVEI